MKISIIGAAGAMGSTAAFAIAGRGLADDLVLIDKNERLALSQALDIAVSTTNGKPVKVRTGSVEADLVGSDLVIVTAGVHYDIGTPLPTMLAPNVPIIQSIVGDLDALCPDAPVLIATNPLDPLTYAACLAAGSNSRKFIGYNLNDTLRFRKIVADTLDVSPSRVDAVVIGEHPTGLVPLFGSIRVDGAKMDISEEIKRRVKENIGQFLASWVAIAKLRSAVWTSAAGIVSLVEAVRDDDGRILPCSACLEGEYGLSGLCIGVPARIGKTGVREVVEFDMADDERRDLLRIAQRIKQSNEVVKQFMAP